MPGLPLRDPVLVKYFGGSSTASGVPVTEWTALNFSSWWGAVQIISNAVAALPLFLYRRLPNGGKERFTGHPLYRILHDEFNPQMTSIKARQAMQAHVLTWGNAYAEIVFNGANQVAELRPITPDRVTPDLNASGDVIYRVVQPSGREVILAAERVLHIQGLGFDGLVGYSVVRKARETIGLGLTAEAYGAQFFGNGAVSSLVATHPKTLNDSARQNLKASITEAVGGAKKHSVLVLEEGMTVEKTSIPPDDAQFLLTRHFQATEVCRWFNLPPHKLAELERATFSNIEHSAIEFVIDCLRPWLVTWEQELNRKVIKPLEQKQQFTEHLVDGLLRGDTPSRYAAYQVGINSGFLCADDVRERENMNPLPNGTGQVFLMPLNMVPSDTVPTAKERIEALGGLIRAGYDPAESLEAVDLPPIKHMGAPPVTVQPKDDYPGAATRGGFGNQPAAKPDDEEETPPAEPEESEPERAAKMLEALREALAGHRDEILAGLPPPPDPAPLLQAVADAEGRLRADVDAVKLETAAVKLDLGTVRTEFATQIDLLPKPDPALAATLVGEVQQAAARLQAAMEDAEGRLREDVEAVKADTAAALKTARTEFATQLELLPKPDPELATTLAAHVDDAEARLQYAATAAASTTVAAINATGDAIQAALATTQQLRHWQENTIAMIAGTLARREMAFAKKLAKDPARAPERLHAHYQRLVEDGAKDLAQFNVPASVRARLVRWAEEASAECLTAIVDETIADLPVRWMERHGALTRALVVAALGPAETDYVTSPPIDDVRDEEEPPLPPVEPVRVEKELVRDAAGRPQTMRQITTQGDAVTIIEKEVIERDAAGRPQKIRETHRSQNGTA